VLTIIITVVGTVANAYVLLALLLSKNSRASNVNVFITHQTGLDLATCALLAIGEVWELDYGYFDNDFGLVICWFFGAHGLTTWAGNSSMCGLIIITVERYVKIVHPVAYRNHYRPWMTRAGIVIPWIFGLATGFIPIVTTTKVLRGRCMKNRFYVNNEVRVAWGIIKFFVLYLVPLMFFVYGYWNILMVIRRQKKQVAQSQQQQGTSNSTTQKQKQSSKTEMNVIRTTGDRWRQRGDQITASGIIKTRTSSTLIKAKADLRMIGIIKIGAGTLRTLRNTVVRYSEHMDEITEN